MHDDEEIDALFAEWKKAMARGDTERLLTLIAEDAEFWTQGAAPVKGRDDVRTLFTAFFDTVSMQQNFEEIERVVAGDIAFIRGFERNLLTPATGGGPVEVHQRAFMLLRRTDGQWRFARGMTNREQ
ncbi:MAG TPA: nuclear transport factor 2 family protein [Thermoanaerobaculia bacterium]